ncbi:thioredoxin-like protein [Mucor mucedo]|uniref:thioredoxin-like protein n=1 Tax=Mucor mucedo TaxID=29922 RepID=UPI00221F590A|nr:thioredoxin-like protein [Mucor mucedo]KAI7894971.1 thioredoxin-like protein [Mucor mucedo]
MSTDKITFYNAVICPYAQRAAIALREAGANFETVDIDLTNKPEWYKDINPETKVPALTTEGQNIAESLVIIEYINDRFPEAKLLPKEAIKRAHVRFGIEYFASKITAGFNKYAFNYKGEGAREAYEVDVNAALVRFNEILTQQSATGPYFLGEEFSLADIAVAPFVLRLYAFNKLILKGYEFEAVKSHSRLAEFIKGVTSRASVQETYAGDEKFVDVLVQRFGVTRD